MTCEIVCLESISAVPSHQWDDLSQGNPLLSHSYLEALEATHCAVPRTGWAARHLALLRGGTLRAAMPLYAKSHSRGEYVFDHAWANAYARYGMSYYPKLISAIPFTPVPGPRLLAHDRHDQRLLLEAAKQLSREQGYSSLHVLFPLEDEIPILQQAGLLLRSNIQFHWQNPGYHDMNAFLAALKQPKRKKLRQERRRLKEAGVEFKWLTGRQITGATLRFLYLCYMQTYLQHGNAPYLNLDFFERLHDRLADAMVVILAERAGVPIAAALNIRHGSRLYGRYWGCTEHFPGLHFETCYMQGMEYCIAHGIRVFEGGAQGEHKLARGMLPVQTLSAHWIEDPVFGPAIADFLEKETPFVQQYLDELMEHSPYRTP
ncbi:GNAT family N-acetyltransferase [Achromobacter sp. F4_2707]|uniref:GNAT family N-acetyltransferase n=1 Tax=Achromobacter sp. F4_2707 TaxID=3114286 RepID=UPI0039C6430E